MSRGIAKSIMKSGRCRRPRKNGLNLSNVIIACGAADSGSGRPFTLITYPCFAAATRPRADVFGGLSIRLTRRNRTRISQLATAEFAKQMLHMPGVVHSPPPFPADTFQMAKTDDDFHFAYLHLFYPADFTRLAAPHCGSSKISHLSSPPHFASNSRWYNSSSRSPLTLV